MEYKQGELICPKCKSRGMGIYTNWSSRDVFEGEEKIKQYIFYYVTEVRGRHILFSLCLFLSESDSCFCYCCLRAFLILIYIILFFWLVDIILHFCCSKKEYCYLAGKNVESIDVSKYQDIW